jgi:hypothetical protein
LLPTPRVSREISSPAAHPRLARKEIFMVIILFILVLAILAFLCFTGPNGGEHTKHRR